MPTLRYNLRSRAMPNAARINRAQLITTRVVAYPGAYAITGTDADLSLGEDLILTAEAGALSLSGQDASLLLSRVLAAGAGSYALTGQDAGLGIVLDLTAEAGAFDLAGQDASLLMARVVAAGAGSIDLSGQDAAFLLGKHIAAEAGAIDMSGQDASLLLDRVLGAEAGALALSGQPAGVAIVRTLTAEAGSVSLSGQDAALHRQLLVAAAAGAYAESGQAATLKLARVVAAGAGSFALTGQAATLTYEENSGITVESTSTATITGGTSVSNVTLPGTPAEDDIYVVAITCDQDPNVSLGALGTQAAADGWTVVYNSASSSPSAAVFLKRMGGTPDTTVPIEQGDNEISAIVMLQVKGVDTTTAQDATATVSTASGMPDAVSLTTVTDGALRIVTGHLDDDDISGVTLTGYTVVQRNTGQSSTTVGATTMVGYKIAASAGAEDPPAFSGSGSDSARAVHLALRPA